MIVVATDAEYALAKQRFKHQRIIKTGVGGLNVIKRLRKYPRWVRIVNFGYAGSNILPIGAEFRVGECRLYHPDVTYEEPVYKLPGCVDCYTSNNFVTSTSIETPVLFDMELAYILALGFKNVQSIKIVSDNLSISQYERNI